MPILWSFKIKQVQIAYFGQTPVVLPLGATAVLSIGLRMSQTDDSLVVSSDPLHVSSSSLHAIKVL